MNEMHAEMSEKKWYVSIKEDNRIGSKSARESCFYKTLFECAEELKMMGKDQDIAEIVHINNRDRIDLILY